jgi:hypothetical protein
MEYVCICPHYYLTVYQECVILRSFKYVHQPVDALLLTFGCVTHYLGPVANFQPNFRNGLFKPVATNLLRTVSLVSERMRARGWLCVEQVTAFQA